MAFKFPDKDPDERLDYTVDWSRYLERDDLTITAVRWSIEQEGGSTDIFTEGYAFQKPVPTGATASANNLYSATDYSTVGLVNRRNVFDPNKGTATIVLDDGENNKVYTLVCEIDTSDSAKTNHSVTTNRRIKIKVRERV